MEVSVLGFGGAEIGFEGADEKTVRELLNDALDAGLNVIDTAECYMNSEELIGAALEGRPREDYYLFTKVGHPNGMGGESDWTLPGILASIERSLRRLRTPHLDLVQLHSCGETILRQGDAIQALQQARDKGYTRFIGYSGDRQEAAYAIESGTFDTLQTSISIADQQAIDLLLPNAKSLGMGVIVKRPVANAAWRTGEKPEESYHHAYWERLQKLDYDFLKGDLGDAIGIALRFTLSQPGVHTAIVGTTRPGRWRENARLLEKGPLSPEEIKAIRARWEEAGGDSWKAET